MKAPQRLRRNGGNRATDAERRSREAAALELLAAGVGSAFAAQTLAERYGVSLRQARRYVAAASFELVDPATPHALDQALMLTVYRLDLIAGQSLAAGDTGTAIRASRAHASALAAFRRALSVPATRFRLPPARSGAPAAEPWEPPEPPPAAEPLPF